MSPKTKKQVFPPVRVDDKLLEDTRKCADTADEYLSDYIRKAVEQRNAQYEHKEEKINFNKIFPESIEDMEKRLKKPEQTFRSFPKG